MRCKITLKQEDETFNNSCEVSFDGDSDVYEWLKYFRRFMLACSFTTNTVDKILPEVEE